MQQTVKKGIVSGLALCVALAASGLAAEPQAPPAVAPGDEVPWQKIETRPVALSYPPQILSPGLFDKTRQHVLALAGGAPVDLALPRAGLSAGGKPRFPLLARLTQDFIWVDLDGNGTPGRDESRRVNPDGTTDLFSADLT